MPPKKQFRKRGREEDGSDDDDKAGAGEEARRCIPTIIGAASASVNTFSSTSAGASTFTIARELNVLTTGSAAPHTYGGDAFAETGTGDAALGTDGRSLLERKLALQATALAELAPGAVKMYRGQGGYASFTDVGRDSREVIAAAKFAGTLGPARAPSNVRAISRMDFAPDICKDYKETGQCPFGDSCIFLHDRSEYKSSWKVDKEWAEEQKAKEERLAARLAAGGTIEDDDVDDTSSTAASALPTACFICRGPFRVPVFAPCGHITCQDCALERFKTGEATCVLCGKLTNGTFNLVPIKLITRLKLVGAIVEEGEGNSEIAPPVSHGGESGEGDKQEEEGAGGGGWGVIS